MHRQLTRVSFTGPDDQTDIPQLIALQKRYPFIEWAILALPERTDTPRYPQLAWINRFLDDAPLQCALHVCKQDVHNFIRREPDLWALAQRFTRLQINFFQALDPIDPVALDATARAFAKPVIVPHNPKNQTVVEQLTAPNIQYLFDRSGGTGVSPESWPTALSGRACGYAGGLKPDNIGRELTKIIAAAGHAPIWIDMESGVRSPDDQFSFAKAEVVARTCAAYVI